MGPGSSVEAVDAVAAAMARALAAEAEQTSRGVERSVVTGDWTQTQIRWRGRALN
jgi:hypothetical protein